MCRLKLAERARREFDAASEMLGRAAANDEQVLNMVAYHFQQSVERTLKCFLENIGVTVPNTHKITKLTAMCHDNGSCLVIPEWLDEHSEMLETWEVETRYNIDFCVEIRKLRRAREGIGEFFRINYLTDGEVNPEINDSVREAILSRLPSGEREVGNFQLNSYFIIFRKHIL